ncbi:MAG: hypothetical protein EPO63_00740 [Candidatus Nitrosotenuis sp.]|nr:MAG: hypothetical protein EPO63_00740 [Candidatus Nitrosotenuis sp.]
MIIKFSVAVIFFLLAANHAFGDSEHIIYDLGTVTDLIPDENTVYFFEADKSIKSPTWILDTKVKMFDGNTVQNLSEKMFIHPTELKQNTIYLFFAILSEDCLGQITCDYQDLIQMAKSDGKITFLAKNLRSSIHISVEKNAIYASESDGKIWKINFDGSKKLLAKTQNIVMDLTSKADVVYWIEEVSDQNDTIFSIQEGSVPRKIDGNLMIPYDLTIQNGDLYWNEIQILSTKDTFSDFTIIKTNRNNKTKTLMEFQNTSPISKRLMTSHYGPYLVHRDNLFLVNNTKNDPVIHMLELYNSTKYDIATISDYDAKYLRIGGNSLYVIGKNDNGFVIGKYPLPIKVPEFPSFLLIMMIALTSVIILPRFWHN